MNNSIKKPKIAIVVPVYNIEKYLCECLDSILKQTYENWDCFVVDDGSTDSSGKIAERYAILDKRFKIIHKTNGGLSAARNAALEVIDDSDCYDYVGLVDGDDRIREDMYEQLVKSAEKYDADIVTCGYYKFNEENKEETKKCVSGDEVISVNDFVCLIMSNGPWANSFLSGGMVWKNLYSSQVISRVRFTLKNIIEDELFLMQIASKAPKVSVVNQPLYGYRQRSDSLVKNNKFLLKHIETRKLCIEEARKISEYARLVAIVAYLVVVMKLFKQEMYPKEMLTEFEVDFNRAKKAGLVGWKENMLYALFTRYSIVADFYRIIRTLFKNVFSRHKI